MAEYVQGSPAKTPVLRPLRQPLYDRETFITGATLVELFVDNKKTNANVAKTERDTNMPGSGQLATPLEFDLFGFQGALDISIIAGSMTDYANFYNVGVFKWLFGQTTTWLTVKVTQIPQGIGPVGFGAVTAGAALGIVAQGLGVTDNFYNFSDHKKQPRRITSNESFKNQIVFPGGVTVSAGAVGWTTYMVGLLYASL